MAAITSLSILVSIIGFYWCMAQERKVQPVKVERKVLPPQQ
jgi:hypothetical protein